MGKVGSMFDVRATNLTWSRSTAGSRSSCAPIPFLFANKRLKIFFLLTRYQILIVLRSSLYIHHYKISAPFSYHNRTIMNCFPFCLLLFVSVASSYTPLRTTDNRLFKSVHTRALIKKQQNPIIAAAATAALALILTITPVDASTTAGQIELNSVPPTSVNVDIRDLPIFGKVLSGTYTKVADGSIDKPSITIKSPKDKVAAIKGATTGHLEFDVKGLIGTHLDVDVVADEVGVATIRIASPLIPKLPFKKAVNAVKSTGDKPSDWSIVTNLGNGKSYYYNEKSGTSQLEKP